MKKIIASILSALFLSSASYAADISYGITASVTAIDASGTETSEGDNVKTSATAKNNVVVGSIFLENNFGNFSLGLDYIPFKADISSKTKQRTDTTLSEGTSASKTNKAQAELSNHITLYGIVPVTDSIYLKGGAVQVDVNSNESLGTGSAYGDDTIYGGLIGVGIQKDNIRVGVEYTDYEDISLTSQTGNKISANIDTTSLKVSYSF